MKYVLTEKEYNELKVNQIATQSIPEDQDLFEFLQRAQTVRVANDPQQYGIQMLQVAISLDEVPEKYLQFIKQRSQR